MRLKKVKLRIGDERVQLDPELYISLKRAAVLIGQKGVEGRLRLWTKTHPDVPFRTALDTFIEKYSMDFSREDIGTGKCMHCMFRGDCQSVPCSSCAFIDDKTPMHRLCFNIQTYERPRGEYCYLNYDCGWARDNNHNRQFFLQPSEIRFPVRMGTTMWFPKPFSHGWHAHEVLPREGETTEQYFARANKAWSACVNKVEEHKDVKVQIKAVIESVGMLDALESQYGGNVDFLLSDMWPNMSKEEIVKMYTRGETGEPKKLEVFRKAKALAGDVK